VGREPTPRQSRVSALRREALENVIAQEVAEGIENEVLTDMRRKTAQLSASQVVTLASMEEGMVRSIRELERILMHTGAGARLLPKETQEPNIQELAGEVLAKVESPSLIGADEEFLGQGGPFIPVEDAEINLEIGTYFETAARVQARINQLTDLSSVVRRVPIGAPVLKTHRKSSGFGIRRDPFDRSKRSRHRGLDFSGRRNTPIVATAPGRVVRAGTYGTFGKMVEIDHGNGFRTRYAHLNSIKTRVGRTVELNQTVGLMGNTGRSTATHLHYEILYRGRQVDPERFIEAGRYVFES
ncbi:MAG: M23 family metallopeptidase, partial [Parvularculaceae bacterium]|nr:M23 family metallopeptidase [Parvularculaceae bacterium]